MDSVEDLDLITLRDYILSKRPGVSECLKIAVAVTDALGDLHKKGAIHMDITPRNILINTETGEVQITGSGCSGSVAYMSPEQTGRLNQAVDYRTDFYSLGVTFYEMLTGVLPFSTEDPLELIYSHIAVRPTPPYDLDNEIPKTVSDIVMKLLSKTPDDRYQSASGLKADLLECLKQLETSGTIQGFTLGLKDISALLQIPQRLYGRQQETAALMGSFSRISAGAKELLLVSGYSGIGKSSLVREMQRPIVRQRGYFISGKFDQYKRNIPYSALIEAFHGLVRQLLSDSDERVHAWKERLLEELGPNVRVITDVIPEVALITGEQQTVPDLPPQEAENRFHLSFSGFVRVFTARAHPVVIFIDDLQWVDQASLKLIRLMMTDHSLSRLLLIGAYRDNEVEASHILMYTLEEIQKSGAIINRIILTPLGGEDVNRLVSDTLRCNDETARPLADLVMRKTGGNPFFVRQFLQTLHDEGLLAFDFGVGRRQWDLDKIQEKGITDNVVELMANKLMKLSPDTIDTLKHAACIGNKFNLGTLSIVLEKPVSEIALSLEEAVREGPVVSLTTLSESPSYAFQHDRIQQAAYSLIPEEEKKTIHLKIGRLLLGKGKVEEEIFEIVGHLNYASELIEDREEKRGLALLNLEAGRRAKKETAYVSALKYFTAGTELLQEGCWQSMYELTYPLYLERAECEYLTTNFDEAERLFDLVLPKARTKLEKAQVYSLKVVLYDNMGKPQKAIQCGLEGLFALNVNMLTLPVRVLLVQNIMSVKLCLRRSKIQDIPSRPAMADKEKTAAMQLLMSLMAPAYVSDTELVMALTLEMTRLSLRYGNAPESSYAYAVYGVFEGSILGNYETGYALGTAASRLCEKSGDRRLQARIDNIMGGYINHWRRPVKGDREFLERAFGACLSCGDLTYAVYSGAMLNTLSFLSGDNLDVVYKDAGRYSEFCRRVGFSEHDDSHIVWQQAVMSLKGLTRDAADFSTADYDEQRHVREMRKKKVTTSLYVYYFIKTFTLYLHGAFVGAISIAEIAAGDIDKVLLGLMTVADFYFYYSLALSAVYPGASYLRNRRYLGIIRENLRKIRKWADNCPENFRHKLLLIEAEISRLKGNNEKAVRLYDQSIQSAHENGFIHHEALANELAGRFHLGRGHGQIAQTYLLEAHACYAKWGADGKVKALEEEYPRLFKKRAAPPAGVERTPVVGNVLQLDMASVIKASQAISSSFDLERLLKNLMRIVIQHAGAQRGLLIMEKAGRLQVAAESGDETREPSGHERDSGYPAAIINYAVRTGELVIVNDAAREGEFSEDPYVVERKPLSIMCIPLVGHGKRRSLLYLENNLAPNAFTSERIAVLNLLSSQIAVSLENALLYKEKEDILRCVHDSLSSDIYNIFLLSEMRNRDMDSAELSRKLSLISETSRKGLQTIRDFLFLSNRECLPLHEFLDMLNDYGQKLFENTEAEFRLSQNVSDPEYTLPPVLVFNLYLIYKEALTNVLKHSGAGKVSVALSLEDDRLALSVRDDGSGFNVGAVRPGGNGVNNMRVRAEEIGAAMTLDSRPGQGTEIRLELAVGNAG